MSIREASAANIIANELIALATRGVAINPDLEHAVAVLLLTAERRLMAGMSVKWFFSSLAKARKEHQAI